MSNETSITNSKLLSNKIQLVNRKTAAALLGVKVNTLVTWAMYKRYNLPFIKIGKSVRYRLSDIEAFLERNQKTST